MRILMGLFGLAILIGIAYAFSKDRRNINWALVATGIALQIGFAALVLLTPWGSKVFQVLGEGFVRLTEFTREGSAFIFGDMVDLTKYPFIFAFQVLPTIIFFASFMAIMYHLGVMQVIVRGMAWAITKVMKVSGAETTSVCASVFIGQTEAPLTVRPYISKMTESELLTMMIGGMAHIAGGVMATYILMLGGSDTAQQALYAKHFLAASIMAAPATLLLAKILVPETGNPLTRGEVRVHVERDSSNVIEAAANGAADGVKLAINIAAMLIAFIALIALVNGVLGWIGGITGINDWLTPDTIAPGVALASDGTIAPVKLSLQAIFGVILAPVAFIIGVPWEDASLVGSLIGQKLVINEFYAYLQLAAIPIGEGPNALSADARLIATYALCGFANFSSIAIQIGGIGGIAPDRKSDLARFGLLAVLGGTLATLMTATIAGVLLHLT
jgi:concentrative nucleoside transporter, CNT family